MKKYGVWLCVLLLVFLTGCQKAQKEEAPFLQVNGEAVTEEEYLLYLAEVARNFQELGGEDIWETDFDGRNALDVAKDSALNSLIAVKVTAQQAKEMDISLSQEEQTAAEEEAKAAMEQYQQAQGAVPEAMKNALETVMVEKQLFQKVKEAVVSSYAIGEAEFQAYAKEYRQSKEAQMRTLSVYSIGCKSQEEAQAAADALSQGQKIETVFSSFNQDESLMGNQPYTVMEQDLEEEEKVLSGVSAGFVSKPIQEGDWYYVLYVSKVQEATEAEVTQALREEYTQIFQNQVFEEQLQKWQQKAVIEQNMALWQQVTEEEMRLPGQTEENK